MNEAEMKAELEPHTTLSVFCMNVGCLPKMEGITIPKLNEQEQS